MLCNPLCSHVQQEGERQCKEEAPEDLRFLCLQKVLEVRQSPNLSEVIVLNPNRDRTHWCLPDDQFQKLNPKGIALQDSAKYRTPVIIRVLIWLGCLLYLDVNENKADSVSDSGVWMPVSRRGERVWLSGLTDWKLDSLGNGWSIFSPGLSLFAD